MESNERFPVLSTVAKVLKVVGWIVVGIGGILLIFGSGMEFLRCLNPKSGNSWGMGDWMGLAINIGIAGGGLLIVAFSELIGVTFAIEKNTRK